MKREAQRWKVNESRMALSHSKFVRVISRYPNCYCCKSLVWSIILHYVCNWNLSVFGFHCSCISNRCVTLSHGQIVFIHEECGVFNDGCLLYSLISIIIVTWFWDFNQISVFVFANGANKFNLTLKLCACVCRDWIIFWVSAELVAI